MIKLCKDWVYDYYKKKIFKFTVAYMILGVLIFTFSNFQLSYINMIYYVMGHPYLIAFFLTPVILFTTVSILSEFMANKNLIIRFNSRKELIKFEIVLSIINVTILLLLFLLISILFANIFADRSHFVLVDPYYSEINNLIGLLVCILKLYIYSISITILNMSFSKIKNNKILIIFDIIVLISFLGYLPEKLDWFFPAHYLGYSYTFNSFVENIFFSTIYFLFFIFISIFTCSRNILKKDVI